MSSHIRPVLVVAQGSFQKPMVYQQLCEKLREHGYVVKLPELPSCSDNPNISQFTLADDAQSVQRVVRELVDEGETVVVVCHSYGGLVGSEAISEDLTYASRKTQGVSGGVIHMFLVASFLLPIGQSVLDAFGESPDNDVKVSELKSFTDCCQSSV